MQRRTALTAIGTGIAGIGTGTMLLKTGTETATAAVSMGELSISGDRVTTADGTISDVQASVSGKWKYELPAGNPNKWIVSLRVSDGNTWATVGKTEGSANYNQYNDTYTVRGSVTDTELFSTDFFAAPAPGKQKSVKLPFEVWFRVLNKSGTPLASTTVSETATVTVGQQSIDASLYGRVKGEGSVTIKE